VTGACECGCGRQTLVEARDRRTEGRVKGQHRRFIKGHNTRTPNPVSYRQAPSPDGPWRLAHRLRAERALGKPLPRAAVVHHADGSRNEHAPLVICENQKYHSRLHARMRIRAAGGNPNTDAICGVCRKVMNRTQFNASNRTCFGVRTECRECQNQKERIRYDRQVAARVS
jgi:uncharacterized CHY-type Zn-finger protein